MILGQFGNSPPHLLLVFVRQLRRTSSRISACSSWFKQRDFTGKKKGVGKVIPSVKCSQSRQHKNYWTESPTGHTHVQECGAAQPDPELMLTTSSWRRPHWWSAGVRTHGCWSHADTEPTGLPRQNWAFVFWTANQFQKWLGSSIFPVCTIWNMNEIPFYLLAIYL